MRPALQPMSRQEAFDFALDAIEGQGMPGVQNGKCVYASVSGVKCAIGHMLTPSEALAMLGFSVRSAGDRLPERFRDDLNLYEDIQGAHDRAAPRPDFLAEFRRNMRLVAKRHDLRVTTEPAVQP